MTEETQLASPGDKLRINTTTPAEPHLYHPATKRRVVVSLGQTVQLKRIPSEVRGRLGLPPTGPVHGQVLGVSNGTPTHLKLDGHKHLVGLCDLVESPHLPPQDAVGHPTRVVIGALPNEEDL